MKILFITDSLGRGGKERRLVELIKNLKINQVDIRLIVLYDLIEFEEIHKIGIKIHKLIRSFKFDLSISYKILKICSEFKPDIINTWGLMPSIYATPVAKFKKIKFINSMIINAPIELDMKTKIFSKIILPLSDIIVGNSYAGLRSYNIDENRGIVIYNGYDLSRSKNLIKKIDVKNQLKVKTRYLCGMVAVFRDHKDYITLIEAAKIIFTKRNDISFVMVGDGPTYEQIKEISKNMENIFFTGRRTDVESIINIFDIGILSTFTEGISNSIMEYMALGKAVIATEGGGTNELVKDNVTGILVPKKSPRILAEKIELLIDNEELRSQLGSAGQKRIYEKFNIELMVSNYYNLFKDVVREKTDKK
jgi:glycosyltransferase involved in cell wall biosynthesis